MTDKPIHEMRLADYKRGIANMERKRQPEVQVAVVNNSGASLLMSLTKSLQRLEQDLVKNGDITQKVRFPRVGERGPDLVQKAPVNFERVQLVCDVLSGKITPNEARVASGLPPITASNFDGPA